MAYASEETARRILAAATGDEFLPASQQGGIASEETLQAILVAMEAGSGGDDLAQRVEDLEAAVQGLANLPSEVGQLRTDLGALDGRVTGGGVSISGLQTAVSELDTRVVALENPPEVPTEPEE